MMSFCSFIVISSQLFPVLSSYFNLASFPLSFCTSLAPVTVLVFIFEKSISLLSSLMSSFLVFSYVMVTTTGVIFTSLAVSRTVVKSPPPCSMALYASNAIVLLSPHARYNLLIRGLSFLTPSCTSFFISGVVMVCMSCMLIR